MKPQILVAGLLMLAFACGPGPALAETNLSIPPSTPSADFIDNGDGTVTHRKTGLMWMRCSLGQSWSGSSCEGSAVGYPWQSALQAARNLNTAGGYAGRTDWRVPNIKELRSIVEQQAYSPSINSSVFPGTPVSGYFWSASAATGCSEYAFSVYFYDGGAHHTIKVGAFRVRLVRAEQSFDNWGSATTTSTTSGTIACTTTTTGHGNPTTTSTPTTSTTVTSTTTTTLAGSINLTRGWNLIGTGAGGRVNVASVFGDSSAVNTVWKWVADGSIWAFYTPALADGGSAYAQGKGYALLGTINPGEGVWVNAKIAFTSQLPAGTAISSSSIQTLTSGWNLIAIGDNRTPSQINAFVSTTTPLTSLWAWDPLLANWYFYAPALDNAGTLISYNASKGYLNFGSTVLAPASGFWVNKP